MNDRPPNLTALVAGASVSAIIPSNLEEIWRLSTMIVEADLAPQALIGKAPGEGADDDTWKRWGKKATSAVATVMMSGAELGLPPMVALRSFTVIGGKPALYGDGLINVVRRSGKCAYVRTGYDETRKIGWCEAKRADQGEEKRVEFSEVEARNAGLWDDKLTRRGKVWKNGKQEWGDVPNDSTWHRYPQRMLAWRAAGYCLRELFADVLGGIRDEFEAREIAGEVIEHHEETPPAKLSPPSPPKPPSPPSPKSSNETEADPSEIVTETGESTDAIMEGEPVDGEPFDFGKYFEDLQIALAGAKNETQVEEIWNEFDVEATFQDDADSRQLADRIKERRLSALNPLASG